MDLWVLSFLCVWEMSPCIDALVGLIGGGIEPRALELKLLGLGNWLQSVQRGLLAKETQSKSDKSPVTVADYGIYSTPESFLFRFCTLIPCLDQRSDSNSPMPVSVGF